MLLATGCQRGWESSHHSWRLVQRGTSDPASPRSCFPARQMGSRFLWGSRAQRGCGAALCAVPAGAVPRQLLAALWGLLCPCCSGVSWGLQQQKPRLQLLAQRGDAEGEGGDAQAVALAPWGSDGPGGVCGAVPRVTGQPASGCLACPWDPAPGCPRARCLAMGRSDRGRNGEGSWWPGRDWDEAKVWGAELGPALTAGLRGSAAPRAPLSRGRAGGRQPHCCPAAAPVLPHCAALARPGAPSAGPSPSRAAAAAGPWADGSGPPLIGPRPAPVRAGMTQAAIGSAAHAAAAAQAAGRAGPGAGASPARGAGTRGWG